MERGPKGARGGGATYVLKGRGRVGGLVGRGAWNWKGRGKGRCRHSARTHARKQGRPSWAHAMLCPPFVAAVGLGGRPCPAHEAGLGGVGGGTQ